MGIDLNAPEVAAVIVTWNKKKDVLGLLENLKDLDYPVEKLKITVVDNNSSDGTDKAIISLFPKVNLIVNRENLGGAGGFNTGMKWALENCPGAEFLWLLDNDVLVDKNALKELVLAMQAEPKAGICGSRIMNIDNSHEMIEVGAFIDYNRGDVRCNHPAPEALKDKKALFPVDYVAACSLLGRIEAIKELGIWHEPFFIYWDDMEWGARFRSNGWKVFAVNGSVVYHPSWAGRVADISAVWRNYYRVRNSLFFFNHYVSGLKRRIILGKMILRFGAYSLNTASTGQPALSDAFTLGMEDFFKSSLGKKEFNLPGKDRDAFFKDKNVKSVCLFLPDLGASLAAQKYAKRLKTDYPGLKLSAVIPKVEKSKWIPITGPHDIMSYERGPRGEISRGDQFRILKFLRTAKWDVLLTSSVTPRVGSIWGRHIVRTDFENESVYSIERPKLKQLITIPFKIISYLIEAFLSPPKREIKKIGASHGGNTFPGDHSCN